MSTEWKKVRDAAEAALAAYQSRFESVAPRIGNYLGPIDDEMVALRDALAASPQPAAQPEPGLIVERAEQLWSKFQADWYASKRADAQQPEPGGLTDERAQIIAWNVLESGCAKWPDLWSAKLSQVRAFVTALTRAIEREVLSTTRKRTAEQNARIRHHLQCLQAIVESEHCGEAEQRCAEIERLLGGEA